MCNDEESQNRAAEVGGSGSETIYSGKNYSVHFLRQLAKRGVDLMAGIRVMEERFME